MIEVILREDIKSLGKAGAMVRVKPGYARNFLLPKGMAYEATEGNKKRIAGEQKARTAQAAADRADAERQASILGTVKVTITAKAGEEGKLFGSVTSQEIAEHLASAGHEVDKRRIELEHPIRQLGQHTVVIRIHPEVQAEIQVDVVAE
jgi:large subunit ribosomal protein L9